jgi:signal transduction histidine kinase
MDNYLFNHILSSSLTFLCTLILGVFVYLKGKEVSVNRTFALYSLSIAIWGFCRIWILLAEDESEGLLWIRLTYVGMVFIPTLFIHFVSCLLDTKESRRWLIPSYLLSFIFLSIIPSRLLIHGVSHKEFPIKYVPEPGIIYPFFMVFFFFLVIYGLYKLFISYRTSTGVKRNQMKYLLFGSLLGYAGGGANFLYSLGKEMYPLNPYSTYAVPIYVVITAYAILKHRLMDINIIIKKTVIYGLLYSCVVGIFMGLVVFFGQWAIYGSIDKRVLWMSLLALLIITFIIRPLDNFMANITDKYLFHKKYEYQKTLREISGKMTKIKELTKLLDLIVEIITKNVRVTNTSILLWDEGIGQFILRASKGSSMEIFENRLDNDNPLVIWLDKEKNVLVYEELKEQLRLRQSSQREETSFTTLEKIKQEMERLKVALCVPILIDDRLVGILVLGEKLSGEMYTQEDFDIFTTLANQSALSIENIQFYDRLIQAERLSAVGRLASNMAHEIKSPLQAIKTFTSYLSEKYNDKGFREEFQRIVGSEVDQINSIVQQLLDFAHPLPPNLQPTKLHQTIDDTLTLLENDFVTKNIEVKREYTQDDPTIIADPRQLKQVFLNLFLNSIDAMDENLITPADKTKRTNMLKVATVSTLPWVIIKILDTGCGIPSENIPLLFDPFFTTKEKGSGLGLSIVQGIIKNHKGSIEVESIPQVGTTFIIKLPVDKDA